MVSVPVEGRKYIPQTLCFCTLKSWHDDKVLSLSSVFILGCSLFACHIGLTEDLTEILYLFCYTAIKSINRWLLDSVPVYKFIIDKQAMRKTNRRSALLVESLGEGTYECRGENLENRLYRFNPMPRGTRTAVYIVGGAF